ncbi:MAG: nitroreductase [Gemmatimonadales bacterium]
MADLWLEPYEEAIAEFPITGTTAAKLEAALRFARRAPSIHNTQPWRCSVEGESFLVHADESRRLRVADPDGRWLLQSVGALVEYLHLVLRRFGFEGSVTVSKEPGSLVARIEPGAMQRVNPGDRRLFDAMPRRRTNRHPFWQQAVPDRTLDRASRHAAERGVRLTILVRPSDRELLAEWVSAADRLQMADPAFRRELARWLRPVGTRKHDGIPSSAGKAPPVLRPIAPLLVRTFDVGDGIAAIDHRLATGSPALAILWTRGDGRADWVAAGRGLVRALLSLAADGISASFLNQAVEVSSIRRELASRYGEGEHAQAVLRLGIGSEAPLTPRRTVRTLLR